MGCLRTLFGITAIMMMVGCIQQPQPTPTPRPLGGIVTATPQLEVEEIETPSIELSINSGGPSSRIVVTGNDFAPEQLVLLYVEAEGERRQDPFAQAVTDELGTFFAEIGLPVVWPGAIDIDGVTELLIEAVANDGRTAKASFTLSYDGAFQTYQNEFGQFEMLIPRSWVVSEPQVTPLGIMTLLGPDPLIAGDPAVSVVLVSETLTAPEASDLLACGEIGCRERMTFQLMRVGEYDARRLFIGGDETPELEWLFFNLPDRMVYLSYHDPDTLSSLTPLLNTISFTIPNVVDEVIEPTAVAAGVDADLSEATVNWQQVVLSELGIMVELPPIAQIQTNRIELGDELAGRIGLAWQINDDEGRDATQLLPEGAEILKELPVDVRWGTGIEYQLDLVDTVATHVIIETGDAAIDFFAFGETSETPGPLIEVLQRIIGSVQLIDTGDAIGAVSPTPTIIEIDTTPTATVPPSATPTPTVPRPDPLEAGPLETVVNLVLFFFRNEIEADTIEYFSAERRGRIQSLLDVNNAFGLSIVPSTFDASRELNTGADVVIRVVFRSRAGEEQARLFQMLKEEDRWRVDGIQTEDGVEAIDAIIDGQSSGAEEAELQTPSTTPETPAATQPAEEDVETPTPAVDE